MSLKLEFVERAMRPGARVSTLCAEYGISRQTGHKWINRYKKAGPDGLEEESRRPKSSPLATAEDVVLAILELRERYPRRGPKKLVHLLKTKLGDQAPSVATIARVLQRFGRVRQKGKFRRVSIVERAPGVKAESCNDIWTVDFKGWWRAKDGRKCEPLTVRDAHSRYVLAIRVFANTSLEPVREVFLKLFRRYGVPRYIQCDNGTPFINVQARGGLTRLSAWWISLGITVIRSRPGCPQDNGGHERMHRDMSEDLQASPSSSPAAEQRACDRWRLEFNQVRPHEALGGKVPAELYKPSKRSPRASTYLYPSGWITRSVSKKGQIKIGDTQVHASLALQGHRVGLEPLGGTKHRMWFREVDLDTIDLPISNLVVDEVSMQFMTRRASRQKRAA